MDKIILDTNPNGTFSLSSEAHLRYFEEKYNKKIYFYTRTKDGDFIKVDDLKMFETLRSRIMTFVDLGKRVSEIPFDNDIRVVPLDERLESDEFLIKIVAELGELANWGNSKLIITEL